MEGKNHRFGKADGVDMIRKRDNILKKKLYEHLPQGREAPGQIMWSLNLVQVQVARIGEGEVIWAMAERKLFGVWCSRCV